jgi:hypothetical protein
MTRFFIYAPSAVFALVVLFLTAHWYSEAHAWSARLDRVNGRPVMPGVSLSFSSKTIAGFPFRLDATFENLKIRIETPHGPSQWQSEHFALHRLIYEGDTTIFEAAGRQTIAWTGLDGRSHDLSFRAGGLRASAVEDETGLERFDFVGAQIESVPLTAASFELHLRNDPARAAIDLYLDGSGFKFSHVSLPSFGQQLKSVVFFGTATPANPLARLREGHASWPASLARFADASGRFRLQQLAVAASHSRTSGYGHIALDRSARPAGRLDLAMQTDVGHRALVISATNGIVYADGKPIGSLSPVY